MSRVTALTCDRCGASEKVRERTSDDYDPEALPKDWRHLAWTSPNSTFSPGDFDLCKACVNVVSDALMRPRPSP